MATNSGEKVFTSWKEIASFFGKGVRTVQRWERKLGLPITRPTAAKNVVLATERELRDWIRQASSQTETDSGNSLEGNDKLSLSGFSIRLKRLEDETARLAKLVTSFSNRLDELNLSIPVDDGSDRARENPKRIPTGHSIRRERDERLEN